MPTTLLNGPTPKALQHRRSCLRDVLEVQGTVVEATRDKQLDPMALASLANALVRLVPLVMALRGRPLFLHGSMTKRMDVSPKEAMAMLRSAKGKNGVVNLDKLLDDSDQEGTTPKESLKSMAKGDRRVGGGEGKEGDGAS